jgi:hypothetical protein
MPSFKLEKEEFSEVYQEKQWTYNCLFEFSFKKRVIKKITITDHYQRKLGREWITQELILDILKKNILVCDSDNFIFASQMARLLVMAKQRFNPSETPQERIKKWEEWIKEKLPNYLLRLEKSFSEWEKDIGCINTSVKSMEKTREDMRKVIMGEMEMELRGI